MAKDKKIEDRANIVKSKIEDGYRTATSGPDYLAHMPCRELFDEVVDLVTVKGFNIEDQLLAEKITRPSRVERVGKTVEVLLSLSNQCKHPLNIIDGQICYYNGKYWDAIGEGDLGYFLTKAATALGVDKYEAMYCDFVRKAAETFRTAGRTKITPKQKGVQLLNCQNCTLEIHSNGEAVARAHSPEDGLKYILPIEYDPSATAPMFLSFLNDVLPEEEDRVNVQEFCGGVFDPDWNSEEILYFYGATGSNGKTTLKDIICAAYGRHSLSHSSFTNLTSEGGTGEASRAALNGKLLNECGDISAKITGSDLFKQIASREEIAVRPPYAKEPITLQRHNYGRLLFCCNELPVFVGGSGKAEARRFRFIEFRKTFRGKAVKLNLASDIIAKELPGILNWMIEGLRRLNDQGGKLSENAHAEYLRNQFLLGSNSVYAYTEEFGLFPYTEENTQRYQGSKVCVKPGELYNSNGMWKADSNEGRKSYVAFCEDENQKPFGKKNFLKVLQQMGFNRKHTNTGDIIEAWELTKEANFKRKENAAAGAANSAGKLF